MNRRRRRRNQCSRDFSCPHTPTLRHPVYQNSLAEAEVPGVKALLLMHAYSVLSTTNHDPSPLFPQHARLHRFRTPLPALFPRQESQHPSRLPLDAPRSFPPVAMPVADPRFFFIRAIPRHPVVVSDDLQPTAPRRTPWRLPPLRRRGGMGSLSWDSRRWGHFVGGIVF